MTLYRVVRGILVFLSRALFRLRLVHPERVPSSGAYVLAPSHRSYLDTPFVGSAMQAKREHRIRRALRHPGAIRMAFQPIVDIVWDERVVGVEALARFSCGPKRPPDAWFAEAAAAGLLEDLELAAVDVALQQVEPFNPSTETVVPLKPKKAKKAPAETLQPPLGL